MDGLNDLGGNCSTAPQLALNLIKHNSEWTLLKGAIQSRIDACIASHVSGSEEGLPISGIVRNMRLEAVMQNQNIPRHKALRLTLDVS